MPLPAPAGLHKRLREFAPQLVHSHHPFLLGDNALRIAAERGLPMVFTHHTMYERYTHNLPFDSARVRRFAADRAAEIVCCGPELASGAAACEAHAPDRRSLAQRSGVLNDKAVTRLQSLYARLVNASNCPRLNSNQWTAWRFRFEEEWKIVNNIIHALKQGNRQRPRQ